MKESVKLKAPFFRKNRSQFSLTDFLPIILTLQGTTDNQLYNKNICNQINNNINTTKLSEGIIWFLNYFF